jgi:membrane-associated protease RseP (regulator of RpoE activity)
MNLDLISAIIFYSIIGILIYVKRHRIEFIGRIVPVYRTQRPIKFMRSLSSAGFFWKVFSTLAIPVAIFLMLWLLQALGASTLDILLNPQAAPAVGLLIPGIKIPGSPIYVPFWYGIIAIVVLVIVHEFTHGTVAINERVKIKSSGVGLFLIFPIAFVEMDETSMEKASRLSRLRVITSASVANFFFAMLVFYLMAITVSPFVESITVSTGVAVSSIMAGFPAAEAGLTEGMIIQEMDSVAVFNVTELVNIMTTYEPGDQINISTDSGDFIFTLAADPENETKAYMGIYFEQQWDFTQEAYQRFPLLLLQAVVFLWFTLSWIANLNMMVGIMNLLPIWIVDGGQMVSNLLSYFMSEEKVRRIIDLISYTVLMILIINLIGPYLM